MKPSYTQQDLDRAIEAIAGGQSIRKAATNWGIPRSTLQDRIHGTESRQETFEGQQRLSAVQEARLASWIGIQEDLGLPLSHA